MSRYLQLLLKCFLTIHLTVLTEGKFPFRNYTLPWSDRVDDLVKRLSIDEVVMQMAMGGGGMDGPAPSIPRLGIKKFQWNTECLRGVALTGKATAFPQGINLGAMFSWRVMKKVALAIGAEVRAKANNYTAHGSYGDHQGMNCWAPMVNIMRHPLWGRSQEVYGEDPYLTGRLAASYIQGLQGGDDRYIQAAASCKAFLAYAGPEDIPVSRLTFDAKVSERDFRLTFLPAYKQCAQAGAYSYMCSYNSVNGVPMCANKELLTDVLRDEWGFKGFVVSDMGAIEAIVQTHKYLNDSLDTIVTTLEAGCNLELSTNIPYPYYTQIVKAIQKGLIREDTVREMVKPLFYTRMRLGEFDPIKMNPYNGYDLSLVQSPAHQELAIEAAMKSFVLLKNKGNLLPLKKKFKQIAVVGPMADNLDQLYGDYNADIDPAYGTTPLQGLQKMADMVKYGAGCTDNKCTNYTQSDIQHAVSGVQLVVVCLGTGVEIECEGLDRADMNLPGKQKQLMLDAVKYAEGAPILLLVFSGGPVNISFADKDPQVDSIMQCFFPAQATGKAIFNTITMATPESSPAGRLPYTWYNNSDQIPSMVDYNMAGHTYRYFYETAYYPFGYGLSYTTFTYSNLVFDPVILEGQEYFYMRVDVTNDGLIGSDEVAQVYFSWQTTLVDMPVLQLVGFDRLFIPPLQTVTFEFKISMEQLAVWKDDQGFVVEKGVINLCVGGQQPGTIREVPSNILRGEIHVHSSFKPKLKY